MNVQHTPWLVAAVLAVAAVDAGVRVARRPAATAPLPSVAPFDPDAATEIRIGGDEDLLLARADGGWRITAPVATRADPGEVGALLAELAGGVHPQVRVDDDPADHARYGLAGGAERILEVRGGSDALVSLVVGLDAGGGATFVRLPGAPDVYRARIGGRARLDRPVGAWRDRAVVGVSPQDVVSLRIPGVVHAVRTDGGWTDAAGGAIDGPTVAAVVEGLAELRAAGEVPADRAVVWDGPEVTLGKVDGEVALALGQAGGAWVVRRADGDGIVRLAAPWLDGLRHEATFRDRTLWSAGRVTRVEVRGPGLDGVMERVGGGFVVRRPGNVDLDPARADAAARFLAAPRVMGWGTEISLIEAGFPSDHRWTVTAEDAVHVLSFGATVGDEVWVRNEARPDAIGRLDLRTVRGVESLFGG